MVTKKAGTVLINKDTKQVALVYRKSLGDLSFPKGHLEAGETLPECAIRETIEETGRNCYLEREDSIGVIRYTTSNGEEVENYMYLAIDNGIYEGESPDPEICVWVYLDEVHNALSYDDLVEFWDSVYSLVKEVLA